MAFRLLSIDDSKAVHFFIKDCLKTFDVVITDEFDGKAGEERIMKDTKAFDMILLDWEMPEQDGLTTLTNLRAANIAIPIVMLTSKNKPEDIEKILNLGASEYMMKPFTADILLQKIEDVVGAPLVSHADK